MNNLILFWGMIGIVGSLIALIAGLVAATFQRMRDR